MSKRAVVVSGLVVVVAGAGYVAASWFTGQLAHQRMTDILAQAEKNSSGVLHVVKRESSNGIFRSVEDVTFEVTSPGKSAPIASARNPNRVRAMNAVFAATTAMPPSLLSGGKVQFTVHNEIQHGPLLGVTPGIARIQTTIVLDDFIGRMVKAFLDTDKPLYFDTVLNFSGGGSVHALSPKINLQLPANAGSLSWGGMDIGVDFTRNMDQMTIDGEAPAFEMSASNGSTFKMKELRLQGKMNRYLDDLFVGNEQLTFKSVDYANNGRTGHIGNASYAFTSSAQDDKLNVSFKFGADEFQGEPMALKDIRLDFSINGIHGPTAAQLYKQVREIGQSAGGNPQLAKEKLGEVGQTALKLLQYSPEFVLDDVGFSSTQGNLKISGRAQLDGVVAADVASPMAAGQLANKLTANVDISLSKPLLDQLGGAARNSDEMLTRLEQQGYITLNGTELHAKLAYAKGAVTANGKPVNLGNMAGGGNNR